MKKIVLLRIAVILEVIFFLFYTASISRDYQDGWILEELELPYIIFIITTVTYFVNEKQFNWMILFTIIIRTTFLMIPNLKYLWFQGIEIDQHQQYRLALDTLNKGYVVSGNVYSQTPLFALSLTIFSMFSGLSILNSIKLYPIILWLTYPIWIYIISKKFDMNSPALKYVVLISSIPIKSSMSYLVTGSLFGGFFLFIILIQLSNVIVNKDRNSLIVILFLVTALAFGHIVTSMILSTVLIIIYILPLLYNLLFRNLEINKGKPSLFSIMIVVLTSIVSISIVATKMFTEATIFFTDRIKLLFNIPIGHKYGVFIPGRFGQIGLPDQIRVLLTFFGADFLFMFLIAVSVIVIIKDKELVKKRGLILLSLYNIAIGSLLVLGLLLNFGANWYDRIPRYTWIFAPVSIGVLISRIRGTRSKFLKILIIGLLIPLATIELYRSQPLIPSAGSLGEEFPADIPLVYVNQANTAYQRYLIDHASRYLPFDTVIAMDKGTGNQLFGLTDSDFLNSHRIIYPYFREETVIPDSFLIHFPGISGKFEEPAQNRTKSLFLSVIHNSNYNVVYLNSESYLLVNIR